MVEATKSLAVVGDEDTVIGFGLAGIKNLIIVKKDTDKLEIINSIKGLIKTPDLGFIIITQQIAESVRAELERMKQEKSLYPILIELPDKRGELPERVDPIRLLIKRAIGMEVVKGAQ
jgi:V/A-type H+-transporting ATPase subunit F